MANIILKPGWQGRESDVTDESIYHSRRDFLRSMGYLGMAGLLAAAPPGCSQGQSETVTPSPEDLSSPLADLPAPVTKNPRWVVDERPLTPYDVSTNYNNFYEFTTTKERVAALAKNFTTEPWTIEVGGLVQKPITIDMDDLLKEFALEERIYRFRCVEAWAMTVPWVGFPLSKLIEKARPLSTAKYVSFLTVFRPDEMPGQERDVWYPWPYYEALRMDEALNDLTLMTVGMYGKVLPNQNGAPLRLIVPWKYGYKSIKSIVRMDFVEERPGTFWNDLQPAEYSFESNVDPSVPHPRWSQATERLIASNRRVATKPYNGYGEWVSHLYS